MGFFRRFWSIFRVFLRSISFGRWIVLFFILLGYDNFEEVLDRFVIDCAAVFYFFAFFCVFLKLVGRRSFCIFSVMIDFFLVFSENWVRKNSIWSPLLNSARRIGRFLSIFNVFCKSGRGVVFSLNLAMIGKSWWIFGFRFSVGNLSVLGRFLGRFFYKFSGKKWVFTCFRFKRVFIKRFFKGCARAHIFRVRLRTETCRFFGVYKSCHLRRVL